MVGRDSIRDVLIRRLEPVLAPHGFQVVDRHYVDDPNSVVFHVDGPHLEDFKGAHANLYQDIAGSYDPLPVPCIDLVIEAGGDDGNHFSLEGMGAEELARHAPPDLLKDLARHERDEASRWVEVLRHVLAALLRSTGSPKA